MKSHTEILDNIFKHKESLEKALNLPSIWIRDKEYVINKATGEKADLVFQDKHDHYRGLPDTTCFVLELKKDKGDHEILGQLQKYMDVLKLQIKYKHWDKVKGIAVAPSFTDSCLKLLWKNKIKTFIYSEDRNEKPVLTEQKMRRKAYPINI